MYQIKITVLQLRSSKRQRKRCMQFSIIFLWIGVKHEVLFFYKKVTMIIKTYEPCGKEVTLFTADNRIDVRRSTVLYKDELETEK